MAIAVIHDDQRHHGNQMDIRKRKTTGYESATVIMHHHVPMEKYSDILTSTEVYHHEVGFTFADRAFYGLAESIKNHHTPMFRGGPVIRVASKHVYGMGNKMTMRANKRCAHQIRYIDVTESSTTMTTQGV